LVRYLLPPVKKLVGINEPFVVPTPDTTSPTEGTINKFSVNNDDPPDLI